MPISHKYQCIFVHIPKNGGTSIEKILELTPDNHEIENREILQGQISSADLKAHGFLSPVLTHLTAKQIYKIIPEETFNDYFKFAIVRNPWDRMLSQYLFYCTAQRSADQRAANPEITLKDFLRSINDPHGDKRLTEITDRGLLFAKQEQIEYIMDDEDNFVVDFIGRFENIDRDFQIIRDRTGLAARNLPFVNTTKHTHYSDYYDEESKHIVEQLFARDIEYFGYSFEKNNWFTNRKYALKSSFRTIRAIYPLHSLKAKLLAALRLRPKV